MNKKTIIGAITFSLLGISGIIFSCSSSTETEDIVNTITKQMTETSKAVIQKEMETIQPELSNTISKIEVPDKVLSNVGGFLLDRKRLSLNKEAKKYDMFVVSYFATWCGSCMKKMPVLEKFIQDHPEVGGVHIATRDNKSKVKRKVKSLGVKTPVMFDKGGVRAKKHQVSELPVSYLVDRNLRIYKRMTTEKDIVNVLRSTLRDIQGNSLQNNADRAQDELERSLGR